MTTKKRLGDMLIDSGFINKEELDRALKLQVDGNRRLGYLLIKMGYINEKQLHAILSKQLDLPIVDIHQEFETTVKQILPRYLCKKYNVIPLGLDDHNILKIAMVDPSDSGAVADIEQYTDKVLQPLLAPHSDIQTAIRKNIPWSLKDIFNQLNAQKLTGLTATVALILIAITIMQYNKDRLRTQYGTKQITDKGVFYQHHELILEFNNSGKAALQGHGAHAQGSYSITFNDLDSFEQFINRKQNDFSSAQHEWLLWALKNQAGK